MDTRCNEYDHYFSLFIEFSRNFSYNRIVWDLEYLIVAFDSRVFDLEYTMAAFDNILTN